jgi:hypothetical protein
LEQVHRIRGKIRNEREAQAKIASSSTCLAAQCFKYRVAGAKSRDFISESRCTELSIGRALDLRYDDVLSAAVTGTEPRVPDRNSRQEFSDRMKAAPVIGLAIGVSRSATHSGRGFEACLRPSFEFPAGRAVRRSTNGSEDGKTVGHMRKVLRLWPEENFVNSFGSSRLAAQCSGTQVANLWAKSEGVNSLGLFGRSSQV